MCWNACFPCCSSVLVNGCQALVFCCHLAKPANPLRLWMFIGFFPTIFWILAPNVCLHSGRLTWNLQIIHLERKMIFQTSMIMFYVNLQGCRYKWLFKLALNICFHKYVAEIRQHHQNQSFTGLVSPANQKHKKPGTPPFRQQHQSQAFALVSEAP